MVQEGIGVTVVPELTLPGDRHQLHVLYLTPRAPRMLALASRSLTMASPAVIAFMTQAREWAYSQHFL
jgi:DNA-binding transcriptional LysR family regulator